jgi:hypothetical protein
LLPIDIFHAIELAIEKILAPKNLSSPDMDLVIVYTLPTVFIH